MKSATQEPTENHEALVENSTSIHEKKVSGNDDVSFESLYEKERKKSQVLLISTGVFIVLFFVAVAYGLRVADYNNRGVGKPGGMMRTDLDDRRGIGERYYR